MSSKLIAMARRWITWRDHYASSKLVSPDTITTDFDLCLPSGLVAQGVSDEGMEALRSDEVTLRFAEASEALESVRKSVRMLEASQHEKTVHSRGQAQNTRANSIIQDLIRRRDFFIETYNYARVALIQLGAIDAQIRDSFPQLSVKDTYRQDPGARREVGASRLANGLLWRPFSVPSGRVVTDSGEGRDKEDDENAVAGVDEAQDMGEARRVEGWIWKPQRPFATDSIDVDTTTWEEEGDRVQWFRAEAEFLRWLEQMELKHFEFQRLISSFAFATSAWKLTAESKPPPEVQEVDAGFAAFAKRKSDMFSSMQTYASNTFLRCGHKDVVLGETNAKNLTHDVLVERCLALRRKYIEGIYSNV